MYIKYNLLLLFLTLSMSAYSNISNNPSNWYVVTDQVMGGKSELEVDVDNGVLEGCGQAALQFDRGGDLLSLIHI